MPPLFVLALVLLIGLALVISLTIHLVGFIIMLAVAGLVGGVADAIVPGRLPYGWAGAVVAGLLGSWLGVLLFGRIGPNIAGIPVISAIVGAIVVAFVFSLFAKGSVGRGPSV